MTVEMRHGPVATGDTQIEIREDGTQLISGMAAVFYRSDDPGTEFGLMPDVVERIAPSAFTRAIEEQHDVRGLVNHDPNLVLGRTTSGTMTLSTTKRGLRYEIPYDEHDSDHRQIKRKLEKGDISGSSFGFRVTGETWSEDDGKDVRTITDVQLLDVSPVTYPAYQSTTSSIRSEDLVEVRAALARHKDESPAEDVPDPLAVRVEELEATCSRLQWQIEELEARLATV